MFLYMLDGRIGLTLNGVEHNLSAGDSANIPAGTSYVTRIVSGSARWVAASSGGNGGTLWSAAGTATPAFSWAQDDRGAVNERLSSLSGIDVTLA